MAWSLLDSRERRFGLGFEAADYFAASADEKDTMRRPILPFTRMFFGYPAYNLGTSPFAWMRAAAALRFSPQILQHSRQRRLSHPRL
jgi:hypothetical protein